MDFLRSLFEEQLEIALKDEGKTLMIGNAPFAAVEILKSDEGAYREEFTTWLNENWLPEQLDLLEQILSIHANRKRFEDMCAVFANDALIPFVGSGMSVPCGLPIWSMFLRQIRTHSSMKSDHLEQLLGEFKYEEAADALLSAMPERLFNERVEHDLRINAATVVSGSVVLLPQLFPKLVLTTNLDNVLEELYDGQELSFREVLSGTGIERYRRVKTSVERVLLKLHGTYNSPDGRILRKAEYDSAYSKDALVYKELSMIYQNHSMLCIGCSLENDRTVGLLADVAHNDQGIPKHYAFLPHPGKEAKLLEREHFLTDSDLFPIWYEGDHDESIMALFVGMLHHIGKV